MGVGVGVGVGVGLGVGVVGVSFCVRACAQQLPEVMEYDVCVCVCMHTFIRIIHAYIRSGCQR